MNGYAVNGHVYIRQGNHCDIITIKCLDDLRNIVYVFSFHFLSDLVIYQRCSGRFEIKKHSKYRKSVEHSLSFYVFVCLIFSIVNDIHVSLNSKKHSTCCVCLCCLNVHECFCGSLCLVYFGFVWPKISVCL